ncbi:MAG: hypothetical protein ACK5M1_06505 [Xanthomarina gelatinilytica]|uniref:hypothetical protein n=1 Tax=Xanthomarina gelatinilytica TaxID=1137281 RepID=UPI003A85A3A4
MHKIIIPVLGFVLLFCSCKSISVQNKQYQTTNEQVVLGSVGQDEHFVLEKTYNHIGIPNYSKPLKLYVTQIPFDKTTFRAFKNANVLQAAKLNINYIDSLETKPTFLNIQTVDEIGLMNMLNDKVNKDVKNYMMNQDQSHIISNVSVVFDESVMQQIAKAEEVFLEPSGIKSYTLNLYKNKELVKAISFTDGVVFGYRTSGACWKENEKYQLQIVDLVEGDNKCPNKTYRSAKRAKKKINYFKF